jgi:hypothetical protein
MNSINLLQLKNNVKCTHLSETLINIILNTFTQSNIKTFKGPKKTINVLKSNKIQIKKDLTENKLIMIMNKISHNNINELIKEYLLIPNICVEQYNIIQNEILEKMVKDITFIDIYIPFIIKVFSIEKYRLNIEPIYFINKLEEIISYYYLGLPLVTNILLDKNNEIERLSYLKIINKLFMFNFFKQDIEKYISTILLQQQNKIDIYYWFFENNLSNKYINQINSNIVFCKENNMIRETLMLESLFQNQDLTTQIKPTKIESTKTESNIYIENIIEEYMYIESTEEIINFITNECKDLENKNLFCKELLIRFFNIDIKKQASIEGDTVHNPTQKIKSICDLFYELINKKIIFKSNISRGLILFLESAPSNKIVTSLMEYLLKFLKTNNITKNIEHVFKKYKIKINYDVNL